MKVRYLLLPAGLWIHFLLPAQILSPVQQLEETLIESVYAANGSEEDAAALVSALEEWRREPVDLNQAGEEFFAKLPFLTEFQIRSFLKYREEHGPLLSVHELGYVYGLDGQTIGLLLPYVRVGEVGFAAASAASGKVKHEMLMRGAFGFEKPAGYTPGDDGTPVYPGNRWLYYARYAIARKDRFSAGITAEKDPGEPFFKPDNVAGFDYYSAHVALVNRGKLKTILIGDYRLHFGQGLVLWNGASPSKSSLPLQVARRQEAILPNRSNDENDYFRGVAATYSNRRLSVTLFTSYKRRDANLQIENTETPGFTSLQQSGLHRTTSERVDERSVAETAMGTHISLNGNWIRVGTSLAMYHFSLPMLKREDAPYRFDFTGKDLVNGGVHYSASRGKVQLFGEAARGNGRWALMNGVLANVNRYASFSLLYRYYAPGYYALHASPFAESSEPSNEDGLYAGLELHPQSQIKISGYADLFRFPWLKYQVSAPSNGSDYLIQVDFSGSKRFSCFARLRHQRNPHDLDNDTATVYQVGENRHTALRLHATWQVSKQIEFQCRTELVKVMEQDQPPGYGRLIFADGSWQGKKIPVRLDGRFSWFSTDGYSSRIYAYEQDVVAGYSFSPLSGKGIRYYGMIGYAPSPRVTFRLRVAQYRYSGRKTVGTGNDETSPGRRTDIRIFVRLTP